MFRIFFLLVFSLLFTACGTHITLMEPTPSRIDAGQGTRLAVLTDGGETSEQAAQAVYKELKKQDYFLLVPPAEADNRQTDFVIYLSQTTPSNLSRIKCQLIAQKTNMTLANETYSIPSTQKPHDAYKKLAETITHTLKPQATNYTVTIQHDRNNPFLTHGADAARAQNLDDALAFAQQAVKLQPENPEAYYLLGIAQRELCDYPASLQSLQKAHQLKPDEKYLQEITRGHTIYQNAQLYNPTKTH